MGTLRYGDALPVCRHGYGNEPIEPGKGEKAMIILGVVLLIIGFLTGVSIIWVLGLIALAVGAVLAIAGASGRAVGGRSHYW